jgi:hypothetical protein
MLALERLIVSWDLSQLITTGEYELGFQDASSSLGIRLLI